MRQIAVFLKHNRRNTKETMKCVLQQQQPSPRVLVKVQPVFVILLFDKPQLVMVVYTLSPAGIVMVFGNGAIFMR